MVLEGRDAMGRLSPVGSGDSKSWFPGRLRSFGVRAAGFAFGFFGFSFFTDEDGFFALDGFR